MHKLEELFRFLGTELFLTKSGSDQQDEAYAHIDSIISNLFPNQLTILPLYQNNLEFKSKDYLGTTKPLAQNSTDLILGIITDPHRSNEIITVIWKTLKMRTETPMTSFLLNTITAATQGEPLSNHKKSTKPPKSSSSETPARSGATSGRQSRKDKHDKEEVKLGLSSALHSFDQTIKLVKFDYSQQSIQLLYKGLTILIVVNPSSTIMASLTIGYQLLLWSLTHKLTAHLIRSTPTSTASSTPSALKQTYLNYHTILEAELLIRILWPVIDPIVLKLLLCCALNLQSKQSITQAGHSEPSLTISLILDIFSKFIITHDFLAASACSLTGPIPQQDIATLNTHPLIHNMTTAPADPSQSPAPTTAAFPTSYPTPPPHYQSIPNSTPVSLLHPTSALSSTLLDSNELQTLIDLCNIFIPPPLQQFTASSDGTTSSAPIYDPHPASHPTSAQSPPLDNTTQSTSPDSPTAPASSTVAITTPTPNWLQLTRFAPVTLLCPFHLFLNISKSCNYSQRVRLQSVSFKLQELLHSTIFYSESTPEFNQITAPLQKTPADPTSLPEQITVQPIPCPTIAQAIDLFQPICSQLNIDAIVTPHLQRQALPINSLNNDFSDYMAYTTSPSAIYQPYTPNHCLEQADHPANDTPQPAALPPSYSLSYSLPAFEGLISTPTSATSTIHSQLSDSLPSIFHLFFNTIKPLTHHAQCMGQDQNAATSTTTSTLPFLFPHYTPPSLLLHALTQLKNISLTCPPLHSTSTTTAASHPHQTPRPRRTSRPDSALSHDTASNQGDEYDFPLPMTRYAQPNMNDGSFDRSLSRSQSRQPPQQHHSHPHSTHPITSHNPRGHSRNPSSQDHPHSNRAPRHDGSTPPHSPHSRPTSAHSQSRDRSQQPGKPPGPTTVHPHKVTLRYITGPLFIPEEYQAKLAKKEAKQAKKQQQQEKQEQQEQQQQPPKPE